jgi:hypothetical protein
MISIIKATRFFPKKNTINEFAFAGQKSEFEEWGRSLERESNVSFCTTTLCSFGHDSEALPGESRYREDSPATLFS